MAHQFSAKGRFGSGYGSGQAAPNNRFDEYDDEPEDEDEDSFDHNKDRIRRNYLQSQATVGLGAGSNVLQGLPGSQAEPIQVKLNESYFSNEKRAVLNLLANVRSKCHSMQMFNPAKNQSIREQQETWNDKEKYTLDSLNEIKGNFDEQFQWNRPQDGRLVWASKLQYFLAITSYSIGLGNVIRFPILVQKNGGLAFIVPFVIMLIVEGIPLFYLELAVGQRMRKAAISCWNLVSPFAAGIGLASAAVSFIIGLYYNTMVAWTLLYLFGSATNYQRPLPFAECPLETASRLNKSLSNEPLKKSTTPAVSTAQLECQEAGPFQYYWYRQTLNATEDVNDWSKFNWPVAFCLFAAWLLSYLCLFKGLSSSKRIVFVTSTFPYVILTIFFFKATSLNGMIDGVYYLFAPEWSKLFDPYIWLQSAAQVFFSLGLGFGGLIALSSYNPVNNNCYKDAIKVSLVNFFTSIYAGIVIFAILGYKAHISYDKCMIEREQIIDYYLSDYNLKVIDYGAVFGKDKLKQQQINSDNNNDTVETFISNEKKFNSTRNNNNDDDDDDGIDDLGAPSIDYFDSSDAIASIKSLDKQLDSEAAKLDSSLDYGDSDTEFIINASSLISPEDLNRIIQDISGLPKCSVQRELDEATQGNGLVFVVMTEAINQFKDAPIWAIIFFLMLLTLGLDSQLGNLEGLLSSLADLNFTNTISRQWVTGFICALSLITSFVMFAHGAGSYMFAIFDEYAGSFSLVLIALFELIAISYIYGLKRFCDDCELMTGKRPPFIILLSWRYISPILLIIVILATMREFSVSITYEAWMNDHVEYKIWPNWAITFGAILIISCVIWIPGIAILKILRITIIPEENLSQCWFPAEDLREFHDIQEEHKVTKLERVLFGFRSDDD